MPGKLPLGPREGPGPLAPRGPQAHQGLSQTLDQSLDKWLPRVEKRAPLRTHSPTCRPRLDRWDPEVPQA